MMGNLTILIYYCVYFVLDERNLNNLRLPNKILIILFDSGIVSVRTANK